MTDPKQKLNELLDKQQKILAAQRAESERLVKAAELKAQAEKVLHDLNQKPLPNR